jgi:hypothetical protein
VLTRAHERTAQTYVKYPSVAHATGSDIQPNGQIYLDMFTPAVFHDNCPPAKELDPFMGRRGMKSEQMLIPQSARG